MSFPDCGPGQWSTPAPLASRYADSLARFLDPVVLQAQREVCLRHGVEHCPTRPDLKVAINLDGDSYPINGLREPLDAEFDALAGWWIWNGERVESQDDFSRLEWNSLHASHIASHCLDVLPYLGLPPGWRFLIAPGHEDVWEDPTLLRPAPLG